MIVRTQDVKFTIDRKPQPRRVKLGFEGDNAVERLRFALPDLGEGQTATLMMSGAYANAVTLESDAGKWSVDLTTEVVGKSGEVAAYVRTENGGNIWQSDVIMLETGKVPDAEGEIEQRYPTAVGQMLTAMAEHSVEMEEQVKRAEDAADRAEAAGGGGGGTGGADGADGEDGGYYTPSVSTDGDLSWSASKPDMPGVETVNIRGPVGPDGAPGKDGTDATVTAENIAAALSYTPADAEEVDRLSEEKADKKDIPAPYTLSAATADALGGVKIGKGLQVDEDGRASVRPDNEYDILYTTTLEEAVTWIDFDLPDCTHVYIEFIVPPNNDGSDMLLPAATIQLTGTRSAKCYSGQQKIADGYSLFKYWRCGVDRGVLYGDTGYSRAATTSVISTNPISTYYGAQNEIGFGTFKQIGWANVSGVIPAGTTITVKGVRANA